VILYKDLSRIEIAPKHTDIHHKLLIIIDHKHVCGDLILVIRHSLERHTATSDDTSLSQPLYPSPSTRCYSDRSVSILACLAFLLLLARTFDHRREVADYESEVSNHSTIVVYRRAEDLPGSWNGKSREASKIAKKIHHPRAHTTKQQAPPALSSVNAVLT
jgi:hypothetical protein